MPGIVMHHHFGKVVYSALAEDIKNSIDKVNLYDFVENSIKIADECNLEFPPAKNLLPIYARFTQLYIGSYPQNIDNIIIYLFCQ